MASRATDAALFARESAPRLPFCWRQYPYPSLPLSIPSFTPFSISQLRSDLCAPYIFVCSPDSALDYATVLCQHLKSVVFHLILSLSVSLAVSLALAPLQTHIYFPSVNQNENDQKINRLFRNFVWCFIATESPSSYQHNSHTHTRTHARVYSHANFCHCRSSS